MTDALTIDENRLWQSLMEMGQIGALPGGGCCRTALSPEDKAGRDLFARWCREAGCHISMDQVGNMYARRPGLDARRLPVATGSHLDTQPHAGKFDGIYGVLAGLEVIRSLNDAAIETRAPIEVIVWTNEEGVRFSPPLAGSSAFARTVAVAYIHGATTIDGTTVLADLESTGYLGDQLPGEHPLDCFIEAHIEQGPILEASKKTIGVVTDVQGIRWLQVDLRGQDSHAGTTPMNARKDALLAAARIIAQLNELVCAEDDSARFTVGRLDVQPNSGATIPGQATFYCDLRHPDLETLNRLDGAMVEKITTICEADGIEVEIHRPINIAPTKFAEELINMVRDTADRLGYAHMDMLSGAGHDAMNVAKVAPAGMIFVPCENGISHNEAESATAQDLGAGAHTLLHVLKARAS